MEAAGELYDRHNQHIFRYVWSRVGDQRSAEDLTGEVFSRMVAKLPNYHTTGVPFRAWLYRIAHNLVVDHHRKEGNHVLVPLNSAEDLYEEGNNPASVVEQQLTLERIQRALEKLDPSQQEVVVLRFLVGLPLQDVALTLDKTVASVKSLQYRGLIALRALLGAA
jgi:RNA polymerase sigma-70 factor (ECF subfamily)